MNKPDLLVTLWPSFPHFPQFAFDRRLSGIRLNSAMIEPAALAGELKNLKTLQPTVPVLFDVKGRQLRVEEAGGDNTHLEIVINHRISVPMPVDVWFKSATEKATAVALAERGKRIIFESGPPHLVRAGESLHIFDPTLQIFGPIFTDKEKQKVAMVRQFGIRRFFLSYVEKQRDIDEFLELTGRDAEVWLKIESKPGLRFVARHFRKRDNLILVAARGDLYVELDMPHEINDAMQLIIEKDPKACAASRLMLSVARQAAMRKILQLARHPVMAGLIEEDPDAERCVQSLASAAGSQEIEASDFHELAWLTDLGYERIMLCDEICLRPELLDDAVNAFDAFRTSYQTKRPSMPSPPSVRQGLFGKTLQRGLFGLRNL